MRKVKSKNAQQLIEFLLIIPFMIVFLGILTEYAYAFNIYLTLTDGLKTSATTIYSQISPTLTQSNIDSIIKTNLSTYLSNNNVPLQTENNLTVSSVIIDNQTSIIMAKYTFIPSFTMINPFLIVLPQKFNFLATTSVPTAFLKSNNYTSGIDSVTLDKVWSSTANFSDPDSFNTSKRGIMKSGATARNNMLFLVPNNVAKTLGYNNLYALVNWSGNILMSGANSYNLNLSTGKINMCSSAGCSTTSINFTDYVTGSPNSYYNIIFVQDSDASDIAELSNNWAYQAGSGTPIPVTNSTDLSEITVDGVLKRALAIISPPSTSLGNYDNDSSSGYKVTYFGSMVFCAPTTLVLSTITTGSLHSINYNFGG